MPRGMDETTRSLTILALNERGEGVADDGTIARGALPGERAIVAMEGARARLLEIRDPNPERAAPVCVYFGDCGGCAAQHMSARLYGEWKRERLVGALRRARVAAKVGALVDAHGEGRRRATFHARVGEDGRQRLGFMRARAHEIVTIEACPLFSPAMAGALLPARALAADLSGSGEPLDIQATASLAGLDFDLRGAGPLDAPARRKLAATAERFDLARVSGHGELVIERRAPHVAFGRALATPPPGGFLQATKAGERALAEGARDALKDARRVADLFCGAGAFALRLAETHEIFAADADAAAIAALRRAAAQTRGLRALEAETRDLFQRPLGAAELDAFDGVLFDPPRVGAEAQARALAASRTPVVVAISCSPESFARDARILVEGGYAVGEATPLDQFRFSPHVEILATFRRPPAKRRRRGLLG
jgi:23S rRNA (uracil1939-C5)-methyltransferase